MEKKQMTRRTKNETYINMTKSDKNILFENIVFRSLLCILLGAAGVIYSNHLCNKQNGKELSVRVEMVDGKKGFSREDISDFAKYACLDSAETTVAFQNLLSDSLRDFAVYFGGDYSRTYLQIDTTIFPSISRIKTVFNNSDSRIPFILNSGNLALYHYAYSQSELENMVTTEDSLAIEDENENELLIKAEEYLEKVLIFPGSVEEYEKTKGYSVEVISLPRLNQSTAVEISEYSKKGMELKFPVTFVQESDEIKKHLFQKDFEAIVHAEIYFNFKNYWVGLPVARVEKVKK